MSRVKLLLKDDKLTPKDLEEKFVFKTKHDAKYEELKSEYEELKSEHEELNTHQEKLKMNMTQVSNQSILKSILSLKIMLTK
jgi:hypothetical protein